MYDQYPLGHTGHLFFLGKRSFAIHCGYKFEDNTSHCRLFGIEGRLQITGVDIACAARTKTLIWRMKDIAFGLVYVYDVEDGIGYNFPSPLTQKE